MAVGLRYLGPPPARRRPRWLGRGLGIGAFPAPVRERGGPPPSGGAPPPPTGIGAAPTSHVIPFVLNGGANQRTARSAGPFKGPAIVTGIHFSKGGAAVGLNGILLGKSPTAVTETNVANTTVRAWTALFDVAAIGGAGAVDTFRADISVDEQANLYSNDAHLGIVILDADFFLVLCAVCTGATTAALTGHVTLLEGVSARALANFL